MHRVRALEALVASVALVVLFAVGPAAADPAAADAPRATVSSESADETASNLKSGLMSPFCPGRTLSGCSSSRAAEWRGEIDRWAQAGLTEQEITARLQARVPEFTLTGTPRGHWRWSIGALSVIFATALLVLFARRSRTRRDASLERDGLSGDSTPLRDPDEDDRLDDLLDDELAALG